MREPIAPNATRQTEPLCECDLQGANRTKREYALSVVDSPRLDQTFPEIAAKRLAQGVLPLEASA